VVPFPAGGRPSHGSWFPSLLWCGASLTGVIALGVGWRPVGPLGCSLSACSQDVVSFIEIKKCKAKKKKNIAPGGAGGELPALYPPLIVVPLLSSVFIGVAVVGVIWIAGIVVVVVVGGHCCCCSCHCHLGVGVGVGCGCGHHCHVAAVA
jgi:hypothetical protein